MYINIYVYEIYMDKSIGTHFFVYIHKRVGDHVPYNNFIVHVNKQYRI